MTTTTSDLLHHSSDDAFSPMGALVYLNFPCGNRNIVSFELSSSNASWKYPCTASNFAKYLAVTGIACKISLVDGNGWTGLVKFSIICA